MSAQSYSVETRGEAALILGDTPSLVEGLALQLKEQGIFAVSQTSPHELA